MPSIPVPMRAFGGASPTEWARQSRACNSESIHNAFSGWSHSVEVSSELHLCMGYLAGRVLIAIVAWYRHQLAGDRTGLRLPLRLRMDLQAGSRRADSLAESVRGEPGHRTRPSLLVSGTTRADAVRGGGDPGGRTGSVALPVVGRVRMVSNSPEPPAGPRGPQCHSRPCPCATPLGGTATPTSCCSATQPLSRSSATK